MFLVLSEEIWEERFDNSCHQKSVKIAQFFELVATQKCLETSPRTILLYLCPCSAGHQGILVLERGVTWIELLEILIDCRQIDRLYFIACRILNPLNQDFWDFIYRFIRLLRDPWLNSFHASKWSFWLNLNNI